jgi:hypothetical protein
VDASSLVVVIVGKVVSVVSKKLVEAVEKTVVPVEDAGEELAIELVNCELKVVDSVVKELKLAVIIVDSVVIGVEKVISEELELCVLVEVVVV